MIAVEEEVAKVEKVIEVKYEAAEPENKVVEVEQLMM